MCEGLICAASKLVRGSVSYSKERAAPEGSNSGAQGDLGGDTLMTVGSLAEELRFFCALHTPKQGLRC